MSYEDVLTDELSKMGTINSWSLNTMISKAVEMKDFESDLGFSRCYKEIPVYKDLEKWYTQSVYPSMVTATGETEENTKSVCGAIEFRDCKFTASALSKITGLNPRTIYKYWQDCDKNPVLFESMVEKRVNQKVYEYYKKRYENDCMSNTVVEFEPDLEIEL
jgi:hypothetical protein